MKKLKKKILLVSDSATPTLPKLTAFRLDIV